VCQRQCGLDRRQPGRFVGQTVRPDPDQFRVVEVHLGPGGVRERGVQTLPGRIRRARGQQQARDQCIVERQVGVEIQLTRTVDELGELAGGVGQGFGVGPVLQGSPPSYVGVHGGADEAPEVQAGRRTQFAQASGHRRRLIETAELQLNPDLHVEGVHPVLGVLREAQLLAAAR